MIHKFLAHLLAQHARKVPSLGGSKPNLHCHWSVLSDSPLCDADSERPVHQTSHFGSISAEMRDSKGGLTGDTTPPIRFPV